MAAWAALALSVATWGAPAGAQTASAFRFGEAGLPRPGSEDRSDAPHRRTLTKPAEIVGALKLLWSSHAALCRFEGCRVAVGGHGGEPTRLAVIGSDRALAGQAILSTRLEDGRVIVGWRADALQGQWRHAGTPGPDMLVLKWQGSRPGPGRIVAAFAVRALVVEWPPDKPPR